MIESALILTAFLSTLLAILDFGQFLFFHQVITERIRNAARYGALNWERGCREDCVKNLVVFNSTAAGTYRGMVVPRLTTNSVTVTAPDASLDSKMGVRVENYSFLVLNPWLTGFGNVRMRTMQVTAPVEDPN